MFDMILIPLRNVQEHSYFLDEKKVTKFQVHFTFNWTDSTQLYMGQSIQEWTK